MGNQLEESRGRVGMEGTGVVLMWCPLQDVGGRVEKHWDKMRMGQGLSMIGHGGFLIAEVRMVVILL